MNIIKYVENEQTSEFYPTPESLVNKMLDKVEDWDKVETVLEPSAGKGDILKGIAKAVHRRRGSREFTADAIELDSNLRSILKYRFSDDAKDEIGERRKAIIAPHSDYRKTFINEDYQYYDSEKREYVSFPQEIQDKLRALDEEEKGYFSEGLRLVHDDFLTYTPYKQYDVIIMNPPFSYGEKHLIKALDMQKNGGQIVCLLNAETIRNPYTNLRKELVKLLSQYNAEIEYLSEEFVDAERRTNVEVALINVNIPYDESDEPSIFERMAKAKSYEEPTAEEITDLEMTDFIKMIINRYRMEVEAGIELIKTYKRMIPYLNTSFDNGKDDYYSKTPIIELTHEYSHRTVTVNSYVRKVRLKYWQALLTNEKFIGKLTSKMQQEYREKVNSFAEYDFSEFNVYNLLAEMNCQIKTGIEEEIMKMFDRLTEEHAYYPECTKNKHLYDGWKTNKAWKLDKKSILPCYGIFDSWGGRPREYEAYGTLADIEKILNYFDGNMTAEVDLSWQLSRMFSLGITKNIHCKFFDVTFYKKGTVHITYTCPKLIERFNIYAAQGRKWLPPSYGTKKYDDMTAEEKTVIDGFQGKEAYAKVLSEREFYLAPPVSDTQIPMLTTEPERLEKEVS